LMGSEITRSLESGRMTMGLMVMIAGDKGLGEDGQIVRLMFGCIRQPEP
jgi:hypothetical protein